MKTAPKPLVAPATPVNSGPYVPGIGALPEQTKRHSVPAHKEPKPSNTLKKNQGPSKADMGAIPNRTDNHNVPSHVEMNGGLQGDGLRPVNALSDRGQTAANKDVHVKWNHKGRYDMTVPSADPEK
jgi:hypothetical protein